MKTLWTHLHAAPVRGLRIGPDGDHVVLDDPDGVLLLDLTGRPVAASGPATAAGPVRPESVRRVSVDGVRLTVELDGIVLDEAELDGPITAIVTPPDGSVVVAGTERGTVYGLRPLLTEDEALAFLDKERDVLRSAGTGTARHTADLYLGMGSARFAVRRLRQLAEREALPPDTVTAAIARIALRDGRTLRQDARAAFEAGRALAATGEPRAAVGLLQAAACDVRLRSRALHMAGECFHRLGADSASAIAYQQAALSGPGEDEKRLLYDSARALQGEGRHAEAAGRFETLLAWDATYHDAWKRHEESRTRAGSTAPDAVRPHRPAVTSPPLVSSPSATLVRDLEARGLLGNSDSRIEAYDAFFYVQFDHTGVHDSAKKRLELVQLLTAIGDVSAVATSLDVGSGTLRYPQVLHRFGVRSYGIDLSDAGIRACVDQRWAGRFAVADGTAMPFRDGSFDLVTCMMGTVNHLSAAQRERFLAESFRTLRPGGLLVVSAWDPACRFQTFMSFYSPAEMAQLRTRLTEREPLRAECAAAGFGDVRTTPFCTFPDWLVTGAGAAGTNADHLARLVDLDRDRTAHDPTVSGQMFLLSARR
ncbi:methyltransferase domain-containing protein [Streptomyces malaysiensis]|uniref:Methyltransferase n=1 Tax=Streptomyces malaysiensis TaxID=92644 RepID=A0A7X6AVL4_STRMQ|nr:methyltransferase domain-containing protein [Streptomyces malaysiensis]NIY63845.1 methyltransferase [Streptomyces malaysiensis]